MNWQIIVGVIFILGSVGCLADGFMNFVIALLIGGGLLYWGLRKKGYFKKKVIHQYEIEDYVLAYSYDNVKFYPPLEMVSKINKRLLHPGVDVILKPEPKNKYDNRAVALYVSRHQIGYLLRGTLQDMANDYIAQNWPIKATLHSIRLVDGEYQGYINLAFYRKNEGMPDIQKRHGYQDIDIRAIQPTNPSVRPNTPLTDNNIVFSGYFTAPIDEMMQIAVDAGAVLKSRVTKNTQYLVVGTQDKSFVDENGMGSKEATATKLIRQGAADIKIIDEKTFLELANQTL